MKVFLIRHGESESDVRQKYDGDYDDHLTDTGQREAEQIAQKLSCMGIQIIFSSKKIRAQETCDILAKTLRCSVEILEGLNEQDIYGAYPELSKDQPEEEYRRLGELLADRDATIEGVESHRVFKERIIRCFERIVESGHEALAIVTHGGPIRCIFREALKLGELKQIKNGAIIELEKTDSGWIVAAIDGAG